MGFVVGMVLAAKTYLLVGVVFAVWFAGRGAGRLDQAATDGTTGFRLLLLPGAVVLWPYLALRLRSRRG